MRTLPTKFWILLLILGVAFGFFLGPIFQEKNIPSELFMVILSFMMIVMAEFRQRIAKLNNIIIGLVLLGLGFVGALAYFNLMGGF